MASGDTKLARNIAGKVLAAAVYAVTIALALYVTRIYFDYPQTDDAYVRANIVGSRRTSAGRLSICRSAITSV